MFSVARSLVPLRHRVLRVTNATRRRQRSERRPSDKIAANRRGIQLQIKRRLTDGRTDGHKAAANPRPPTSRSHVHRGDVTTMPCRSSATIMTSFVTRIWPAALARNSVGHCFRSPGGHVCLRMRALRSGGRLLPNGRANGTSLH